MVTKTLTSPAVDFVELRQDVSRTDGGRSPAPALQISDAEACVDESDVVAETSFPPDGAASAYPDMDRGWPAWRFVLSCFTVDTLIWGGNFSWGTWQAYYISHPPFDTSSAVALSSIGTLGLALAYVEMLAGILVCRKWPHHIKKIVWFSLAVFITSLVAASFANSLGTLILTQGLLAGISGGFIYAPIYVWLSDWFIERRALAGGTVFSGAGLGGFAFPLILDALLPRIGHRWTLRVYALIQLVFLGAAVHGMRPRIPFTKPEKGVSTATPFQWRKFRDPIFLLFSATVIVQGLMFSPILVYLPSYATSFLSPTLASLTLSILNILSVPGQILVGAACDKFAYTKVMMASALVSIVSIFGLLRVSYTAPSIFIFAVIMGTTGAGFSSTWFVAATDIAGKSGDQAGPIFGVLSVLRGMSAIVGPILAGLVYDPDRNRLPKLGRYGLGTFVLFTGGCAVVTALGTAGVEIARRRRRAL